MLDKETIISEYRKYGKIKLIGATTVNEYNKFIAKDKALARRFEIIKTNDRK